MIACPYCKTQNRADAIYCNICGGALYATAAGAARAGAPAARKPVATGQLPPQTFLGGRYVILQRVGQGGMAAVYKGSDTKRNRVVAIKEMSQEGLSPSEIQESIASFKSEADLLTKLENANLPKFFQQFSENARHYLVMEFVEGQTLEQIQTKEYKGGIVSEARVMKWAAQLCDALGYLHMQRPPIIFRDLKPANIMITPQDQVKLIDFGIARVFQPNHTRDTQALGTPGYAPPEQYGKAQTDPRADIYALGCTLYQMLSGYETARTPFALPPLNSRNPLVSPHIQLAIEKATRLDRDKRFATMAEFKQALLKPDALYFLPGDPARNLRDVIALCQKYPQEGQRLLYAGHIASWLQAWGRGDAKTAQAALAAQAAVKANPNDRATGLASFLKAAQTSGARTGARAGANGNGAKNPTQNPPKNAAKSPGAANWGPFNFGPITFGATGGTGGTGGNGAYTTQRQASQQARPRAGTATGTGAAAAATATATRGIVVAHPRSVDYGLLMQGQRGVATLTISGQGGGAVNGQVMVDKASAGWLTLDRATFNGASTLIQVNAETARISRTGSEVGMLQIISGAQTLYVPVKVDVAAAPITKKTAQGKAAPKTAARAKNATQQPRRRFRFWPFGAARQGQAATPGAAQTASPTKNAANARQWRAPRGSPLQTQRIAFSGWRLGLSLALPFALALAALVALQHLAVPRVLALIVAPAPYGALALALLAVCALVPWLGAAAIAGAWRTASRRLTTTLGALAGFIAALLVEGHWLFTLSSHALLIGASGAPLELAIVPPALVSLGAALGADPIGSRWALNVIRFTARHPYLCVMPVVIALGAWAGFAGASRLPPMLWGAPNAFLVNVLGVIGLVIGVIVGAALINPTRNVLRYLASVRP